MAMDETEQLGEGCDPAFFDQPSAWHRHDDPDGGECIEIRFQNGGRVLVHTNKPLLFIEPERH